MVLYFTSTTVDPPAFIYVGKDKVESELHPHLPFHPIPLHPLRLTTQLTAPEMRTS
jgi:hypothetical protein